jgi:membrane associated rhomboid family serine protease
MYVTYIIMAAAIMISIMAFNNAAFFANNVFHPVTIIGRNQWYRFISHGFVHGNYFHLFVNMYVLFTFGKITENFFSELFGIAQGRVYFLVLYFGGLIFSSLPSFAMHKNNPGYSAVGASGAVSSIVFACIFIDPKMQLGFLMLPIRIPGWIFGLLYLGYSWYMSKKQLDNVGHDAHFYGAVFGIFFCIIVKWQLALSFWEQVQTYF